MKCSHTTYVWEKKYAQDGAVSGTVGKGLRLEAIEINLTGDLAEKYDVYYRVQAQKIGWLGWCQDGSAAGTAGYGYRLEAIQILLNMKNSFQYDNSSIPDAGYFSNTLVTVFCAGSDIMSVPFSSTSTIATT